MNKKYYITTPIYYPSGKIHIGHCYTTIICDSIARYKRLNGYDVFFLTGTDEHGIKIEKKAKEKNMQPKEFVDKIVNDIKDVWNKLNISYDKFIRTTDLEHIKTAQKIFEILYNKGDIYKSKYQGWYCTPCESFWTDSQLIDNKCPDCNRDVTKENEECYFFKLSKYADKIIEYYEQNKLFLQPNTRINEMINNFLKPGLQDLCVSRTTFTWGIPVTFDNKHIIYVWIDALTNYLSALGYLNNDDKFKQFWPADVHVVGKEIVRFHAIIWPALLFALDLPLPKQIYGHGWLMVGNKKVSKSDINRAKYELIDPLLIINRYGVDALRYYLLSEIQFGKDLQYTTEDFLYKINSELVNSLGNLLTRSTAMMHKYYNGNIINFNINNNELIDVNLINSMNNTYDLYNVYMNELNIQSAIKLIFDLIHKTNKYIDDTKPWILAKNYQTDINVNNKLINVLYNIMESIRIIGLFLRPFMPDTSEKILAIFKININKNNKNIYQYGYLDCGDTINQIDKLFDRIDINKEIEEIKTILIKQ